jgi:Response regulator receiver domain
MNINSWWMEDGSTIPKTIKHASTASGRETISCISNNNSSLSDCGVDEKRTFSFKKPRVNYLFFARREFKMTPIKVLLVDDEEKFVISNSKLLGKRGYDVSTALDGKEALKKLESGKFDAAVLDVKMPGMDGIAVLKKNQKALPAGRSYYADRPGDA